VNDRDWRDPFRDDDDDEATRERARRRAEREARRRERRQKLADRVEKQTASREAAAEPPPHPAPEASHSPETVGSAAGAEAPEPPGAAGEEPAPARSALAAARRRMTRPRGRAGSSGRPPSNVLWRRRLLAFGLLAGAFALAVFGATTVADRLGGSGDTGEPSAAEPEPTVSVTIPEGFDRRQIAAIAEEAGLRGNYVKASRRAKGFNPGRFGADDPDSLEGFLFPATYDLPRRANVNRLVGLQLQALRDNIDQVNMRRAERGNLTEYDVLKIASMIEREVQVPKERRLVAAVIYNRLADGSPLGIDATIRYEDQNFEEPLTESRLAEPTPYNTRIHPGLPPTPIGNPGLAAIRAAANPANVDHFYYVVKPDTCGEHVFTASEQEFQEAVAEYQRRLEEEGGAPTPDDC